jgi:hypothetical protein
VLINKKNKKIKNIALAEMRGRRHVTIMSKMNKTKPNAKCSCGSGKKYKKCCRKNDRQNNNRHKKEDKYTLRVADYMTPFIRWVMYNRPDGKYDPSTNSSIIEQLKGHFQMKINYLENPTFFSSHPKYCKPEDLWRFKLARGGEIVPLKNNQDGWFSMCFSNAWYWCQYKENCKPIIGWLMTGLTPEMAKKSAAPSNAAYEDGGMMNDKIRWTPEQAEFAAELHLVVQTPQGLYDPTPDYDPSIKQKLFITDPKLQKMIDGERDWRKYQSIINTIRDFTEHQSGFLHKPEMFEWKCPHIMCGF